VKGDYIEKKCKKSVGDVICSLLV